MPVLSVDAGSYEPFDDNAFEFLRRVQAGGSPKFGAWVIFDHCLPFDVTRAYDEATKHRDPRVWTAQRDKEMWDALEG